MRARLLGWAGVQLQDGDSTLVIDPLATPAALWDWAGDRARDVPLPEVVAAEPAGTAVAGLLTHLHRDHADVDALAAALAPGAPVLTPPAFGVAVPSASEAGVAPQAAALRAAGLDAFELAPWQATDVGGWSITALPAVDGVGDVQVSWLVERGGRAVVHAGDTLPHTWWWRIPEIADGPIDVAFLPVNAARVQLPHRVPANPLPAVMGGEEAVLAARQMHAARLVPIHHGAFTFPPLYVPDEDARSTVARAADEHGAVVELPALGEWFDVHAPVPV